MAEYRGSARNATRHSGRQYGSGFQYRDPEIDDVELGPWNDICLVDEVNAPKSALVATGDGIIQSGKVIPIWSNVAPVSEITDTIIGIYEVSVGTTAYTLVFQRSAADQLIVASIIADGTVTENTYAGIAVTTSDTIRGFQWGDYFYFGSPGITTGLVRYAITTPAINEPATTHTALYDLFLIDNNAISVEYITASKSWLVSWSVDSLPEDWTNAGSGSKSYYDAKYISGVAYSRYGVLMFSSYAERIEATGTADPSFAFSKVEAIDGAADRDCVVELGGKIWFLDSAYKLNVLVGDEVKLVDGSTALINSWDDPKMFALRGIGLVAVAYPNSDVTKARDLLMYNSDLQKVHRSVGQGYGWSVAATSGSKLFYKILSSSTLSYRYIVWSNPSVSPASPYVITAIYDANEHVIMESLDLQTAGNPSSLDVLVYAHSSQAAQISSAGAAAPTQASFYGGRYDINQAGRAFQVRVYNGTWTADDALTRIVLRIRKQQIT